MRALIQLVTHAKVVINHKTAGEISRGIVALMGLEKLDTFDHAKKLLERIISYRIFPDQEGKTNLSLAQVNGGLLLVPQFTLVAETHKGTRPGFSRGMPPQEGKILFEEMVEYAKAIYPQVASGEFGAYMQVTLCNDGPMTFLLEYPHSQ